VAQGDEAFGGSRMPSSTKYIVSWVGVALSLFVAMYAWFIPADDLDIPSGRWLLSLVGVAMFAFALWGNRYFRRRMREEGQAEKPSPRG
jgi:type IV secretory pathway TrbL component